MARHFSKSVITTGGSKVFSKASHMMMMDGGVKPRERWMLLEYLRLACTAAGSRDGL